MDTQVKRLKIDLSYHSDVISHYSSEFEKIDAHATKYAPTIKIFANGNGEDTRHIDLNKKSATALIQWLTDNYLTK
jgi:hypothetical protein